MKYIELFAGIGGMGHGLMQAGMECVGYCEIDKFAHQAFKILHDPNERMWEAYDVRSVTDEDIRLLGRERGPIDIIAGGFPCQAFSNAGKRKGFQDSTRGTLFFEIVRFASILKPKYLLLENVTGLLNHDGGRTFETVIRTLDELGYVGEWCVLNSAAYVPQNRERVFIIASLGGSGGRKIFPFGEESNNAIEVIGKLEEGCGQEPKVLVTKQYDQLHIRDQVTCLDANYAKGLDNNQARTGVLVNVSQKTGVIETENAACLDANYFKGLGANQARTGVKTGYRIRKLSPLECFRLQTFPDEWFHKLKEHGISDSQLYKMAGNAVTSRVAYEIAKRLLA